jgi:hypothetical protein
VLRFKEDMLISGEHPNILAGRRLFLLMSLGGAGAELALVNTPGGGCPVDIKRLLRFRSTSAALDFTAPSWLYW